ncbi:unnamed protein product [Paramecium pentaurelia]|uniref:Uncharacterized protein n=1 Tax=Paramecium pentaurelia TaxID=43138 RepID=A0A8S1UIS9_9CILI|nr:unnamed protein product [Paramecium pentaurelia]
MNTVIEQNKLKNLATYINEEERKFQKHLEKTEKTNQKRIDLEEEIHKLQLEIIKQNHMKENAEKLQKDYPQLLQERQNELINLQKDLALATAAKKAAQQEFDIQIKHLQQQIAELRREKQDLKRENLGKQEKQTALRNDLQKFGKALQSREKPPVEYKIYSSSGGFGPIYQPQEPIYQPLELSINRPIDNIYQPQEQQYQQHIFY